MTITVGTNSYVSAADADTYFTESLGASAWADLDSTIKETAIITAARMLDRQVWAGTKTNNAQAMQWPRIGVFDAYGVAIDSSIVPPAIINGQCELAFALYNDPTIQSSKNTDPNIKRLKAGTAEVEFMRPIRGQRFPVIVQELVGQFLGGSVNIVTSVASGTCEKSKFDPDCPKNNYDLTGGFS